MITATSPPSHGDELGPVEIAKLENLEIVIENGIKSFLDVGRALLQIRDERLYRATHGTFASYCSERWGMTSQHANRLATAADIVDSLEPAGSKPTSESQVRPLTRLPANQRAGAWQEAVDKSGGTPTAAVVAEVVSRRQSPNSSVHEPAVPNLAAMFDVTDEQIAKANVIRMHSPELAEEVKQGRLELDAALAQIVCPNCKSTDWTSDEMGCYCSKCKDPGKADGPTDADSDKPQRIERIGVGVIYANEAINALQKIPKRDKLRKQAWQLVHDWLEANR